MDSGCIFGTGFYTPASYWPPKRDLVTPGPSERESTPAELPLGHSEPGCRRPSVVCDWSPLEPDSPESQFGFSHLLNFSWGDEPGFSGSWCFLKEVVLKKKTR